MFYRRLSPLPLSLSLTTPHSERRINAVRENNRCMACQCEPRRGGGDEGPRAGGRVIRVIHWWAGPRVGSMLSHDANDDANDDGAGG